MRLMISKCSSEDTVMCLAAPVRPTRDPTQRGFLLLISPNATSACRSSGKYNFVQAEKSPECPSTRETVSIVLLGLSITARNETLSCTEADLLAPAKLPCSG